MNIYQMACLFTEEDAHDSFDQNRAPGIPTTSHSMPELVSSNQESNGAVQPAYNIYQVVKRARQEPEEIHCIELGLGPYPHLDEGPILHQVV